MYSPDLVHHAESPTFEEAVFAVNNVDFLPLQAGCSMKFTVILIEFAIRSTHRHITGLAVIYASTFRLIGLLVHNALASPATVLLFT